MIRIIAVTQRELSSFFFSPIAYVVLVGFLIVSGIFFGQFTLIPGSEASLERTFETMVLVLVFVLPMLTMRLLSEEYRSGMIETLMTLPIRDSEVVVGKFLGTFLFYLILLASTLVYVVILEIFGSPDYGLVVSGYVGTALLGALYISVGMLTSACTRNQVVAVVISFIVLGVFTYLAEFLASKTEGVMRVLLQYLSIIKHHEDFRKGLMDSKDLVFFVSGTAFFLFVSTRVLESKRWR
jgi:ABC-2 type transport system permease protein